MHIGSSTATKLEAEDSQSAEYSWNSQGSFCRGPPSLNQILRNLHVAYTLTYETCEYVPLGTDACPLDTRFPRGIVVDEATSSSDWASSSL